MVQLQGYIDRSDTLVDGGRRPLESDFVFVGQNRQLMGRLPVIPRLRQLSGQRQYDAFCTLGDFVLRERNGKDFLFLALEYRDGRCERDIVIFVALGRNREAHPSCRRADFAQNNPQIRRSIAFANL